MNLSFLVAAAISGLTFAIHTFVGGPRIAGPLLKSDLPSIPRLTSYYCWHLVTLVLVAMTLGFGYAALRPEAIELAVVFTGLAVLFAGWSVLLVVTARRSPVELPQWALFLPVSVAGLVGLVG